MSLATLPITIQVEIRPIVMNLAFLDLLRKRYIAVPLSVYDRTRLRTNTLTTDLVFITMFP